jgi:hypothetical protein
MIGGFTHRVGATLLLLSLPASVFAQSNTSSPDPEGAGFSAKRLGRVATWYQAQVDAGTLPGAVVAITVRRREAANRSRTHLNAHPLAHPARPLRLGLNFAFAKNLYWKFFANSY